MELPVYSLDLRSIALRLEGLEETIIYHLIERVQFKLNQVVYEPGRSGFQGDEKSSLLDIRLLYHERMDADFGRFCVPEERPFYSNLPAPRRRVNLPDYPLSLKDYNAINLTAEIKRAYIDLLPALCSPGDDGQYGSSIEHDVFALQAIARRIHYGALFVAECKYCDDPRVYDALIRQGMREKIIAALTRTEVEESIITRVREKVDATQASANRIVRILIDPDTIVRFYRDAIIPLTKEGELRYLLARGKK